MVSALKSKSVGKNGIAEKLEELIASYSYSDFYFS